ncbi:MAG: ATP-dependent helicase HrpB [Desulfuromonas sp.]|nr:MAG: ATP-dependent helicase HrpB [Desulfuromonas sp.]
MSRTPLTHLQIDAALETLALTLQEHTTTLFIAPPGEGKTTRAPLRLLQAPWLKGKRILMLEPRRLAAVNAAEYMARQLGERPGEQVGYTIRYARKVSSKTRIEVLTEGVLARRLQQDPELHGVGLVIFDEFHERSLQSDLALALCRDSQQGLRDDLRLLVMSATLDAQDLARRLDDCPVVSVSGKRFPVEVHYAPAETGAGLEESAAREVRKALQACEGDLLVFLPGAREIERCKALLGNLDQVEVRTLYGDLPFARQQQAILPGPCRRVVLTTNIAETSLTIEGVAGVIDCGYERRPRFHPGSGLSILETVRISQQSAEQRAGRAGRLGPGRCWRLWSEGTHGSLLPVSPPEILRADLSDVAMELAGWGVEDPARMLWLDPPPEGGFHAARELLNLLGALNEAGGLSTIGNQMLSLPAHPRLARLLVEAKRIGATDEGSVLVAMLSENETLRGAGRRHQDLLERYREVVSAKRGEWPRTQRAIRYWRDLIGLPLQEEAAAVGHNVARLLAVAYPDRIAVRRDNSKTGYVLSSGRGCRLDEGSCLMGERLMVAPEISEYGQEQGVVRWGCPLDERLLHDGLERLLREQRLVTYEPRTQKVEAWQTLNLLRVPLEKQRVSVTAEERGLGWCDAVSKMGLDGLNWSRRSQQLHARMQLLERLFPDQWPHCSPDWLVANLAQWLLPYLQGLPDLRSLRQLDPGDALLNLLQGRQFRQLDALVPERYPVASGSKIQIDYCVGEFPVLAVKLQELFGCQETPLIADGRQPLMLHLLSPAGRPVQMTTDLRHFWRDVYPEVRKELRGRYPKHPWPEDPMTAPPTRHIKRRSAPAG